jgi:hypothetical protein
VSKILTLAASFAAYGRILYQSLAKYRRITQLHNTLTFLTLDSHLALKFFKSYTYRIIPIKYLRFQTRTHNIKILNQHEHH